MDPLSLVTLALGLPAPWEAHGACAENIGPVMDMSASCQAGVCEHRSWVAITFDEFHVIQLVNKAVDAVRRQEIKGPRSLRCTHYIWLKDRPAWSNRQIAQFADLKRRNLKTHRGCRIQETLREIFHSAQSAAQAGPLLDRWYTGYAVAAWSRSKRWPRRLRSTC